MATFTSTTQFQCFVHGLLPDRSLQHVLQRLQILAGNFEFNGQQNLHEHEIVWHPQGMWAGVMYRSAFKLVRHLLTYHGSKSMTRLASSLPEHRKRSDDMVLRIRATFYDGQNFIKTSRRQWQVKFLEGFLPRIMGGVWTSTPLTKAPPTLFQTQEALSSKSTRATTHQFRSHQNMESASCYGIGRRRRCLHLPWIARLPVRTLHFPTRATHGSYRLMTFYMHRPAFEYVRQGYQFPVDVLRVCVYKLYKLTIPRKVSSAVLLDESVEAPWIVEVTSPLTSALGTNVMGSFIERLSGFMRGWVLTNSPKAHTVHLTLTLPHSIAWSI